MNRIVNYTAVQVVVDWVYTNTCESLSAAHYRPEVNW